MPERTIVHGFVLYYEKNDTEGMRHLNYDLDYNEAKVFFDQARLKGSAPFEDDEERQYTLSYKNGVYTVVRR